MSRFTYCHGWNSKLWKLSTPISEEDARRRFESSDPDDWFTVVAFGDGISVEGIPDYTIEILPKAEYFKVFFYDQTRSIRYIYGLRKHGERLFHQSIIQYTYPDELQHYSQSKASIVEMLRFESDGIVHQRLNDKSKPMVENNSYRDVDVSSHWEPIPEFGDWESVARFDR